MRIEPFQGFGPRARKEFWANVASVVNSNQKNAGKNVSVDERTGKGTVINVRRDSATTPETVGACCIGEVCSITTETACRDAGGIYQGDGTDCSPNPCEHCNGGGHFTADFTFSYDNGVQYFEGTLHVEGTIGELCTGSTGGIVLVTVHQHGDVDCSPDAEVGCAIILTYLGGGSWHVSLDNTMEANATTCGPSSFPAVGIGASFSGDFSGSTLDTDLTPGVPPWGLTSHVTLTITP